MFEERYYRFYRIIGFAMTGSPSLWLFICFCSDHMVFFVVFQSVFVCDFRYTMITWSLSFWSSNLYLLMTSIIYWSYGFLFVIFQSVFACEFCHTLIIWSFCYDLPICICLWLLLYTDHMVFSCDLSICICFWILLYTDHMVFSLWSFNLDLLVNSVIHWSHGLLFVIF